jgi:hypothetical protein
MNEISRDDLVLILTPDLPITCCRLVSSAHQKRQGVGLRTSGFSRAMEGMMETTTVVSLVLPTILAYSWFKMRGLEYILIHYRWMFVMFFLMPLSVTYDLFFYVRNMIVFKLSSAPDKHDEKVKFVQRQASIVHLYHFDIA